MISVLDKALFATHPKHLWKRYLVAVALIAMLLGAAHVTATLALQASAKNAELINLAGRQRMFSQRIMYLGLRASHHTEPETLVRLDATISALTDSQRALARAPGLTAELVELYRGEALLNNRVEAFALIARRISSDPETAHDQLSALLDFDSESLLQDLNRATLMFEAKARRDTRYLALIETTSFYAALVVLMIEAIIIFAPAHRLVTRAMADLEAQSYIATQAKQNAIKRNRELESLKEQIEHDALHDPLTGLPNRRALETIMLNLKQVVADTGGVVSVLHLDLDRFKQINDTLGHAAGDHVLTHIAGVLQTCTRPQDFVARMGGDEFVILPALNASTDDLVALSERIILALREPVYYQETLCHAGASIGISQTGNEAVASDIDPADLLVKADIALYRAKESGRNRYAFFTPDLAKRVEATKRISDELLDAIYKREFLVHYQPIFCARTEEITSLEALVRWRHPTRGILSASTFFEAVYRLGLAEEIDLMVLERIEADVAEAKSRGISLPSVAMNVSAQSLKRGKVLNRIKTSALISHGLALEISESVDFEADIDRANVLLQSLRRLGVRIEIDDFGTGHASIFSFQKIAPDRIKIARELLQDVRHSEQTRQLIRSACQLAKSFNAGVVAEGAEDAETARLLHTLGCDFIQGFGLSRPKALPQLLLELSLIHAPTRAASA